MKHKITTALILAAGSGSRLEELTKNTAKPLLKVRDQVLIERLISQLQLQGISDINIVTGYKGEQFEYLKDLYGVKLFQNNHWFYTNNIMSFLIATSDSKFQPKGGVLMCDADLYITDLKLFQKTIKKSGYFIQASDNPIICSNEWTVKTKRSLFSKLQFITEVQVSGYRTNGNVLRSLSYWTSRDFKKLTYLANHESNRNIFIDTISCLWHKRKFKLAAYTFNENSLFEIDSKKDYEEINK